MKRFYRKNKQDGFMLLLSAIIVTSSIVIVGVSISLSKISVKKNLINTYLGAKNFFSAQTCLEEGVYRFTNDFAYTGGSLVLNNQSCEITVDTLSVPYTVKATVSNYNFVQRLEARLVTTGDNLDVVSWRQVKQ